MECADFLTERGIMASQKQENKALRKMRTMRYFIDATREIIETKGVEGVTIRDVAAKAGYSSGSIYEYFESIDQLIAFATIDSINDFLSETASHIGEDTDPLECYLITWYFFAVYAFEKPALYEKVVLLYGTNIITFLNDYYHLFPNEQGDYPSLLKRSFFVPDRGERDNSILLQCAKKGYLNEKDIGEIARMVNAGFLGCLKYRRSQSEGFDSKLFIKMIRVILIGYNPELCSILDRIVLPKPRTHKI